MTREFEGKKLWSRTLDIARDHVDHVQDHASDLSYRGKARCNRARTTVEKFIKTFDKNKNTKKNYQVVYVQLADNNAWNVFRP